MSVPFNTPITEDPLPTNPCNCIPKMIKTMTIHNVRCLGLIVVEDEQGKYLFGLHTNTVPKLIGSKTVIGLLRFSYCPFCGERLTEETTDEILAKEN